MVFCKANPRKLNMNSLANRDRQFQAFIEHCATKGLKYEFFVVNHGCDCRDRSNMPGDKNRSSN